MADDTKTPLPTADETAKHNADIAAKVAAQDASGKSTAPSNDLSDTDKALDTLAAEVTRKEPTPEEKAATEKAAAEKAAADKAATEKTAADKAAAEKAAAEAEGAQKKATEIFKDSPQLPAGASPKSSEAFASIKLKAVQEISKLEAALEQAKKDAEGLKQQVGKLTPEQEQELKELAELRKWRASVDVDADPQFKAFDQRVSSLHEFIYAQLRKSPVVTDATIEAIKKNGGPENINLPKLFESIKDPTLQRLVEAKVADVEQAKYEKEQAIKAAKTNLEGYLSKRTEQQQQEAAKQLASTAQILAQLTESFDWYKERQLPENATDADKAGVEEHNKFLSTLKSEMAAAVQDNTPQMRAILIAGYAKLMHMDRAHATLVQERDTLKKSLEEVTNKLERIKKASVSRLAESGAPASGGLPTVKAADQFHKPAGQALDDIAKQVAEEYAAKKT